MLTVDFARSETPTTCSFGVTSEVGLLRRVLIHTPSAELDHLQPGNALDMLFDDSPAPARAADEHRAFEALLHESGVDAVQVKVALQAALAPAAARHAVIRAIEAGHATMPGSVDMALRELLSYASPAQLADLLIHGVTMRQLDIADVSDWIDPNEFALRPLPNQVFTRDSSFVVGDTICLPSMAKSARTGEALVIEAVYRALQAVDPIESCDHEVLHPDVEGGDVLVVNDRTVVIGQGERNSPSAVLHLAEALICQQPDLTVVVTKIPRVRSAMHLDTVMTFVDEDLLLAYEPVVPHLQAYTFARRGGQVRCVDSGPLLPTLAAGAGTELEVIETKGSPATMAREQWNDAYNVLCLRPRTVIAYARNHATNDALARHGVDVLAIDGNELGRGRGGPRCMSAPLLRDHP